MHACLLQLLLQSAFRREAGACAQALGQERNHKAVKSIQGSRFRGCKQLSCLYYIQQWCE
jgi:hypothetical protein